MEKLLTLPDLASYLQMSKEKLYRMAKAGKIPASKLGGSWRFKKTRVDSWVDQMEVTGPAKEEKGSRRVR